MKKNGTIEFQASGHHAHNFVPRSERFISKLDGNVQWTNYIIYSILFNDASAN